MMNSLYKDQERNTKIIVNNINRYREFRGYFTKICILISFIGLFSFLFYGFNTANNVVQFISDVKNNRDKIEKLMINPRIIIQNKDGELYDILANKAAHKDKNDIEFFDVRASGKMGNITSGKLLITNNGDDLFFSDHPILILKEEKNEQ